MSINSTSKTKLSPEIYRLIKLLNVLNIYNLRIKFGTAVAQHLKQNCANPMQYMAVSRLSFKRHAKVKQCWHSSSTMPEMDLICLDWV